MLDFIKKYRNSPCRTVVTFKMNDCVCFNKLGELNQARKAKNEHFESQNENENDNIVNKEDKREVKRAFREQENAVSACSFVNEKEGKNACDCGCESELCIGDSASNDCFCLPCAKADLRGGINCEKTMRVLLCDLVAGAMAAMAVIGIKMLVFKGK